MALRRWTTSLLPAVRQMSTSTNPPRKKGRIIEVEKISWIEKCVPFAVILGFLLITTEPRDSQRGFTGEGWIGEVVYRIYGRAFVYRRPIQEQIKEQKRQEYAEGKEWPWRIWVG